MWPPWDKQEKLWSLHCTYLRPGRLYSFVAFLGQNGDRKIVFMFHASGKQEIGRKCLGCILMVIRSEP